MSTKLLNGSIALGLIAIAFVAGWRVGTRPQGSITKYYVYEYVDSSNTVTAGFACKCKISGGKPRWIGIKENGCDSSDPANLSDSPFKLTEVPVAHPVPPKHKPHESNTTPVPNVGIPEGACCRQKPHALGGMGNVIVASDGNCAI